MAFRPGVSGNAKGRPPGRGAAATLRIAIEKGAPRVLIAVLKAARNGDIPAARLILDRCCPPLRPTDAPIVVSLSVEATNGDKARAVVDALLTGRIDPSTAGTVLAAMSAGMKVIEIAEFDARLQFLETALKVKKWPLPPSAS
jgi:hypothetical protein